MLLLSFVDFVMMEIKPETTLGLLKGIQSFLSFILLLSFLQIVGGWDAVLVTGPDGPLLVLPWSGGIVLFMLAVLTFWAVHSRTRKLQIDVFDPIQSEFPITKTSTLMAKEIERLNKTVDRLDLVASLALGWTLVLVPFYIVFVLIWVISFFSDRITVFISSSWQDVLGGIIVWGIANLLFILILDLYRIGKRLARYSEILAQLDPELL